HRAEDWLALKTSEIFRRRRAVEIPSRPAGRCESLRSIVRVRAAKFLDRARIASPSLASAREFCRCIRTNGDYTKKWNHPVRPSKPGAEWNPPTREVVLRSGVNFLRFFCAR